jgi:hypothetical protein
MAGNQTTKWSIQTTSNNCIPAIWSPADPRPISVLPIDCLFTNNLKKFELVNKYHEQDSILERKEEERKVDKDGFDNERINHNRPPEVTDYQLLILRNFFQLFLLLLFQCFTTHSEFYFGRRSGILLKLLTLKARQESTVRR